MSTNTLPAHLAAKADSIQAHIRSRLPESTILPKDLELQLDSTSLITPESGYLTARQLGIIALDAVGLVEALSRKDFTAEEVTEAYSISASIAHQTTNCLTWYDSESALAQAKALDASFGKTGEICGPLHGVVISLKRMSFCPYKQI
jgi:amidase